MASNPFKYERQGYRFGGPKLQISKPPDALTPSVEYPILKNVRSYSPTTIQPRPGLSFIAAGSGAIHTIKRINDDLPSAPRTFSRVIGAGAILQIDNALHNNLSQIDSGYSGNPLSIIPFRPSESPDTWTYIGDSNKQRKINIDGTLVYNQGILPPTSAPTGINGDPKPTINPIQFDVIEDGSGFSSYSVDNTIWTANGQGGFADTITSIKYDVGSTGWASVVPTIFTNIQPKALVKMNTSPETVVVDSVYLPVKNTTIASITYDSGSTGLCTIQPTAHKAKSWVPNALIQIGAELVRVIDVSFGKDNIPSIRASTTSTHIMGEAITGLTSWRAYFVNNHASSEGYNGFTYQPNHPGGIASGTQGVGTALRVATLDLSNVNGRPIQDSDTMIVAVTFRHPEVWTELQLILVLDNSPTTTPTDYYQVTVRPSDFTPVTQAITSTLSTKQKKIQKGQIDSASVDSDQSIATQRAQLQRRLQRIQQAASSPDLTPKALKRKLAQIDTVKQRIADLDSTGSGQTGDGSGSATTTVPGAPSSTASVPNIGVAAPVIFNISDVARFGSDQSKNWANVTGILIKGLFNNQTGLTQTNNATVEIGGWWIGGTFGPTTDNPATGVLGVPYLYRARFRNSLTGARSGHGPATRTGTIVTNSRVQLVTSGTTDGQVDKVDWERFGGSIPSWKYLGTSSIVVNGTSQFNDDFPDDMIASNPDGIEDFYAPYVIQDIPRTGTCNVSGTMVTLTSGSISTKLALSTLIIINSIPQNVYRVVDSTHLEIVDNAGALTNVSYFIPAGTIQGVALPVQWGPHGELNTMFACGDTNNPGRVYYTNPNDPDSTATTNWFEPASPSEAAISGFVLDSKAYVFTSERLFAIYPKLNIDPNGIESISYLPQGTPCKTGLYARWFHCESQNRVYFGSKDGIYYTDGSSDAVCITNDISLLFPHESQAGVTTNGHIAPDYTQVSFLRLSYGNKQVRFEYKGIDSNLHSLIYNEDTEGWISQDDYNPQIQCSYVEEAKGIFTTLLGGTDGKLYSLSGNNDNGSSIAWHFRTWYDDKGDARAKKRVGDVIFDCDPNGATIAVQVGFDNFSVTQAPTNITGSGRLSPQPLIDINSGQTTYAKNTAIDVSCTSILTPICYLWDWSALARIEDIVQRTSEWDNGGIEQAKFFQGFRLRANTFNVAKQFKVQSDTGVNELAQDQQTYTYTSNGDSVVPFSFDVPFIAHLVRIIGTDSIPWEPGDVEWIFEPEPELVSTYETQFTSHGLKGYWHLRDGLLAYACNVSFTLQVFFDDGTNEFAINNNNNLTTFPSSSNVLTKAYIRFGSHKQKLVQYKITTGNADKDDPTKGVRIYKRATEFRLKSWADQGPYITILPFGEEHNISGARV